MGFIYYCHFEPALIIVHLLDMGLKPL